MKFPDPVCVLVAGNSTGDVEPLVASLRRHFGQVESSTDSEAADADIGRHAPDVVVLAFQDLGHAQPYCQALSHPDQPRHPHRTILLCRQEDAATAFALCKKQYFDDYVVYWPSPQDALRVAMSVWLACRVRVALREQGAAGADLQTHARHLRDLDRKLTREIESGERQAAAAHDTMVKLEQDLSRASDEFSSHLVRGGTNSAVEVKDSEALSRDLAQFKTQQLELTRSAREQGIKPISAWARQLREKVEPALAGTRALAAQVRPARPTLLVVDEDATMRGLLAPALRELGYDLTVIGDGKLVLRELVHAHPDAILLDIRSSGSNAIDLTRHLKTLPDVAHIPIIIMSGDARRETLISSLKAGASDFIAKPFTREVLRAKLDRVLQRAAALAAASSNQAIGN
jgi:CheY-like chemotaxis protein